ncbi:heme peroxidase [Ochromonadaceae sp. CCMP2298]|nr:heme peroxidase [Ochromonadaceae sp. CCMP2298]|mmetsp:Transcript_23855/g.53005  ORF Transcript_23855/g.53005 Transcript_23855/m.53005 type:complete len:343 (-) Transcript_23855:418-1446(-)
MRSYVISLCVCLLGLLGSNALYMSVTPRSNQAFYQKNLVRSLSLSTAFLATAAAKVSAKTFFDTDVYGDKELKIATVNKIKQKLRNAILLDPAVAPNLLKLAINDALGFDYGSQDGGPDGSVQFEMEKEENQGLQNALDVVNTIKKALQRTTQVSFADICAFAGAEALETVGCGRMTVQVGRFDAKAANSKGVLVPWSAPAAALVTDAFKSSGLGGKELVLLLGALGEVSRVAEETLAQSAKVEESEDDKEFEEQPFVPTTFGSRDAMYGAKLGKGDFSSRYLSLLLKSKSPDPLGKIMLDDPALKAVVQKYAGADAAFVADVQGTYLKLGLLGEAYTTRNS